MILSETTGSVFSYNANAGYFARIVSSEHLKELEDELTLRKMTGDFDENFYHKRLTSFKYTTDKVLPDAGSIIIIAAPQPVVILIFH